MRLALLLILTLTLAPSMLPTGAAQYSVGVRPGDWTKYQISGDLSENAVVSNLTVIQVSRTNVTVKSTDFYNDGTNSSNFLWVDISTGQNNTAQSGFPAFFFIILPSRGIGEGIYGVQSLVIQNSLERTYVQTIRRTNFANITTVGSGSTSYYWDAQTGILAEILQLHQNRTVAIHAMIVATSLWSPQPQNSSLIFLEATLIGVIGAGMAVLAYARLSRRHKRKKPRARN